MRPNAYQRLSCMAVMRTSVTKSPQTGRLKTLQISGLSRRTGPVSANSVQLKLNRPEGRATKSFAKAARQMSLKA